MKHKKIISGLAAFAMLSSTAFADVNYTAQKGDSYWNIAQKFNISLSRVLDANNADSSSTLMTGQTIIVPSDTYTVQKGDSFFLIAQRCNVNLQELLSLNNATESSILYIGKKIKLPYDQVFRRI